MSEFVENEPKFKVKLTLDEICQIIFALRREYFSVVNDRRRAEKNCDKGEKFKQIAIDFKRIEADLLRLRFKLAGKIEKETGNREPFFYDTEPDLEYVMSLPSEEVITK